MYFNKYLKIKKIKTSNEVISESPHTEKKKKYSKIRTINSKRKNKSRRLFK